MTNNQIFRRILIVMGIICVFLLGCIMNIPVSAGFFGVIAALTVGLLLGYCLGTGKDLKFWKNWKKK